MDLEKKLDFQKIINSIARESDGKFHFGLPGKFSVGTVCKTCLRRAYFGIVLPKEFSDDSLRNFLLGNIIHDLFQKNVKLVLGDDLLFVESEKASHYLLPLKTTNGKRIVISGRLDSIFYLKGEEKPIIVDYKTAKNLMYFRDKPLDEHVAQLNFYLSTFLADEGILVYIDKTNLEVVQHNIKFDEKLLDKTIDNAVKLFECLEKKKIPGVDVAKIRRATRCAFCDYEKECLQAERDAETDELLK